MKAFKTQLKPVVLVSGSGTDHPYYSVKTELFSDEMLARVTCNPPLGYDTVVAHDKDSVKFSVFIESQTPCDNWEVQVWHNVEDDNDWTALPLRPASNDKLQLIHVQAGKHHQWFTGSLKEKPKDSRPLAFTVRFRVSHQDQWKWAHDQSGIDDGHLLFQAAKAGSEAGNSLTNYFDTLDSHFRVENVSCEPPDTSLWSLEAPVPAAKGDDSGYATHALGLPSHFVRWFSIVRLWSPWIAPRQGKGIPLAEKDALLYTFLRKDGLHVALVAISGIDDVLTVFRYENKRLVINARNDQESKGTARVVIAVGRTFDNAVAGVMYEARKIVTRHLPISDDIEDSLESTSSGDKDVKPSWFQDWVDGFTYCTWNGLGQNLTEEKILGALKSLDESGIKIANLIIDDNWQDLDNEGQSQFKRGWKDFDANEKGFPGGFGPAIRNIRGKYDYIEYIGVWHALLGYWGGISPEGRIAKQYKTKEVKKRDDSIAPGKFLVVDAPDMRWMYQHFYNFMLTVGINASKTDAQFFVDEIDTAPERRTLIYKYIDTWIAAQQRHFRGHAISCMSQTPQIIFRGQLPLRNPTIPVRNSDDFFPDVEDSHPWHIFCNANNAVFTKHLNVVPDWDMFQSGHHWSGFHAAARCLSGGPIYITDEPGKHDVALVKQMTGPEPVTLKTVILRPSCVGRSLYPYIGYEEQRLCKVGAYWGFARTGTSFMGLFNCHKFPITEIVPLGDFMGAEANAEYVVRSHRTGAVSPPMTLDKEEDAQFCVQIDAHEWEILAATWIREFALSGKSEGETLKVSNLGLVGKMTGGAALLNQDMYLDESKNLRISARLKVLGTWGLWISGLEDLSLEDDFMVLLQDKPIPFECMSKDDKKGNGMVVQVDLERAWKEMRLHVDWPSDVLVNMYIRLP